MYTSKMNNEKMNIKKQGKTIFLFIAIFALCLTSCIGEQKKKNNIETNTSEEVSKLQNNDKFYKYVSDKPYEDNECKYYYQSKGKRFSIYNGKKFEEIFLKGVNIGAGAPNYFPGELGITKKQYQRWFEEILALNANCIRVYTLQNPEFYQALYEFNQKSEKPLYVFHGTWLNEDLISATQNAFNEKLRKELLKEEKDIVDVIHGNCTIPKRKGHAYGDFKYDISKWVIGWILGMESDAEFVVTTNELNKEKTSYNGKYFKCENVSPFEVYWAQTADEVTSYEMDRYGLQRPLSLTNWPTTDPLSHPSETMDKEDRVSLNIENIKAKSNYKCGLFASYHIYSYYPNFMYTQKEYKSYKDKNGDINTYEAYLKDIKKLHKMPVLVSEFGIPTCKGVTHDNPLTGYNQGNVDEVNQGKMLSHMITDIHEEDLAGGMVFAWQDEWFKRTWNTENFTDANRRAYWTDLMTNEQHFGLLEFTPGENGQTVVIDGKNKEWDITDKFYSEDNVDMYVKSDCGFLYIMLNKKDGDWSEEKAQIPFDITSKSGSKIYKDLKMDRPADFILNIDGKENTQLLVQEYYDRYRFEYSSAGTTKPVIVLKHKAKADSSKFNQIRYLLERQLNLPDRKEIIKRRDFYGGKMVFGTSDYEAKDYNSIADFSFDSHILEIRIPWQLLNFRDPSRKSVEDDFWTLGYYKNLNIDEIYLGLSINGKKDLTLKPYTWENWDTFKYKERLRKSYYILREKYSLLG